MTETLNKESANKFTALAKKHADFTLDMLAKIIYAKGLCEFRSGANLRKAMDQGRFKKSWVLAIASAAGKTDASVAEVLKKFLEDNE